MDHYFQSALAPTSQFASHLANEKLSHSTIKSNLSAVRHLQIASELPDPGIATMPRLEGVIKGIKSIQARAQSSKRTRLPITPHIIMAIGAVWEAQGLSQDQVMLWAALTLCFFGLLRSGEVTVPSQSAFDPSTHLTFEDIKVDNTTNPTLLKVRLKSSKTDPFRKGVDVVVGRTNNKLCPVAAVLAYLALRGNGPGFLFKFQDGKLLTKTRFIEAVRSALDAARLEPKAFAGHSFRIGAATTANACGLNDSTIQMLGRWSSSAYLVYIQPPREQLATFSPILSQASP